MARIKDRAEAGLHARVEGAYMESASGADAGRPRRPQISMDSPLWLSAQMPAALRRTAGVFCSGCIT